MFASDCKQTFANNVNLSSTILLSCMKLQHVISVYFQTKDVNKCYVIIDKQSQCQGGR